MGEEHIEQSLVTFDVRFRQSGIDILAGVDEAGRGPLAGPVVAAAVILPKGIEIPHLNDSKKITAGVREKLFDEIREKAITFGIGSASVEEIGKLNILQATFLAMRRAVEQLLPQPDYLLVDGRDFPLFVRTDTGVPIAGRAIVKGDGRSQVIAAASVLAKVRRDRLMSEYARMYPQYGFERHKGYGTKEHRQKILRFGACPIHRKKFIRKLMQSEANLFGR